MVRNTVKRTKSKQPRKQRKARYRAPIHRRRKMMASPLSRELREKHDYYPRRMTVRKGDIVRVTRGEFRGHEGKVLGVGLKKMKITIDGMTYQKADGKSVPKPIDASNVEIVKLDLSDRTRKKVFERIIRAASFSEEEMKEAEEEIEESSAIAEDEYEEEEPEEEEVVEETEEEGAEEEENIGEESAAEGEAEEAGEVAGKEDEDMEELPEEGDASATVTTQTGPEGEEAEESEENKEVSE